MSSAPTWEQKFEALQGLGEAALKMRAPGKWYVSQPGVEIKALRSGAAVEQQDGESPEKAVNLRWSALTEASAEQYVEHRRGRLQRRVRWNGFMWADLLVEADAESAAATT